MKPALSPRLRRALRTFWAAAALTVVVGSLLPAESVPVRLAARLPVSDKALHFCAYAVLAFLPVIHERIRTAAAIAVCLTAAGVAVEFGQAFLGSRFFETADMAANGGGVLFGVLVGLPHRALAARTLSTVSRASSGSPPRSRRRVEG